MKRMGLTGHTLMAGVMGSPVRHSLSPVIHAAAFDSLGLDWASAAFPVAAGDAERAVEGMRALDIQGMSVTLPHKAAVVPFLDELAPSAERLGVVNCIHNQQGHLVGHSTDGIGFVASVTHETGFVPAGRRCLVIGAGGAARSIIAALGDAGATEVGVLNRTRARAEGAAVLAGDAGGVVEAASIGGYELVVNTTSVGMDGDPSMPCDPDALNPDQTVIDIIYKPLETPWLSAARASGITAANGVGMLVHQAVEQIRIWTGQQPSADVMSQAARQHLTGGANNARDEQ